MRLDEDKEPTIEELLKILERKKDRQLKVEKELTKPAKKFKVSKHKNYNSNKFTVIKQKRIHEFVKDKQFEPGTKFIEAYILFYYFKEWYVMRGRKKKKTNIIAYKLFKDILRVFFPYKMNEQRTTFFGINKNIREDYLTPQKEAAIRRWHKDEHHKRKKEKANKKIQKQVSES